QRVPDGDVGRGLQGRQQTVVVEQRVVVRPRRERRLGEDLPPALSGQVGGGQDRGQKEPDRRHEPGPADHEQDAVHRPLADEAEHLGGDALLRRGGWEWERCRCHTSLLKRRMLSARTGITSRKRKTAMAEPTPKFCPPWKAVRYMARAITLASDWV